MFCKIRKGKWSYSIYACDRKRVNGKVVSNDIKIDSYGWHSLYEDKEEVNGLIDDIPVDLMSFIKARCIRNKDVHLDFDDLYLFLKFSYSMSSPSFSFIISFSIFNITSLYVG